MLPATIDFEPLRVSQRSFFRRSTWATISHLQVLSSITSDLNVFENTENIRIPLATIFLALLRVSH
jgi:hypothetical protein